MHYTALINHNEKTINRLYKTQYYTFDKTRIILRFVTGLALIIICVASSMPMWIKALLLLIGAWLVSSPDFPAQVMADKVLSTRKNNLPVMNYEFHEDYITLSGEGSMNIEYKRFKILLEDSEYYYMFMNKDSACMIDKGTLTPHELDKFAAFIETKTGLTFRHEKSLLAMNLQDLRKIFHE
ncbi:MAG: YcxB family protein [Synergistaceae bacterium]|nr:YcxB family protein [Synergistaceae bacterium]